MAVDGELDRSDDNLVRLPFGSHSKSLDLSTIWEAGGVGLVKRTKGFLRPGTANLNVNGKLNGIVVGG